MEFGEVLLRLVTLFYTSLTGLMANYYDIVDLRIRRWPWLRVYCGLSSLLMVAVTPFFIRAAFAVLSSMGMHLLFQYTMITFALLLAVCALATILFRWRTETRFAIILAEFRSLEDDFFASLPEKTTTTCSLDRMLHAKLFLMIYKTAMQYWTTLKSFSGARLEDVVFGVYMSNLLNIIGGALFLYFVGLWHIQRRLSVLNSHLLELMDDHATGVDGASSTAQKLDDAFSAHGRLTALASDLNGTYKHQHLTMMLTSFVNNVSSGVHLVFFHFSKAWHFGWVDSALSLVYYAMGLLDMCLFDSVCELIARASTETSIILRCSFDWSHRNVEIFCLRSACNEVHISVFGMLTNNRQTSFFIVSNIILYTVVLVQSEYRSIESYRPESP